VLVVSRGSAPLAGAADALAQVWPGRSTLAATGSPRGAAVSLAAADAAGEPQTQVADGNLVRDARLERYFAAHTQFSGSSALGVPSGFLRAATTQTPDR
jgi:sigma-E factor negative regulatory protein RseA